MRANTSIKEGGKARYFGPVAALMVQGDDGKYYPWVPESERQLGTKSISKNGVYQAKKDGVYGWRSVSVNVPTDQGVTGTDPTTGQQVSVGVGPTGELTETVVPVEIRVITPPNNPYGRYIDGQTIAKDGMVVKAYDVEGNEMQTVPNGQITLNPDTAMFDASKDQPAGGEATSDLATNMVQPIRFASFIERLSLNPSGTPNQYYSISADAIAGFINNNRLLIYAVSSKQPAAIRHEISYGSSGQVIYDITREIQGEPYTYDGKTVYFVSINTFRGDYEGFMPNNVASGFGTSEASAWTMIYGDVKRTPAGSPQTITVLWPRTGDGAVLETTFDILVGPRGGQGDD